MNLTNVSKINGVEKERMLKLGNILRTRIVEGATSYILYRKNTNFGIDLSSEDFSTWTEAETIESAGNFSSINLGGTGDQTFAVLATDGSGNYSDPVGCYCQPDGVI
jgi:hypothetical protein